MELPRGGILQIRGQDLIEAMLACGMSNRRHDLDAPAQVAGAPRIDSTLKAMAQPYLFGRHTLWRARIHALLGDRDQAVDLLRTTFWQAIPQELPPHTDLAFELLRDYPPFAELVKPKG